MGGEWGMGNGGARRVMSIPYPLLPAYSLFPIPHSQSIDNPLTPSYRARLRSAEGPDRKSTGADQMRATSIPETQRFRPKGGEDQPLRGRVRPR
jgi:hypothetical protein